MASPQEQYYQFRDDLVKCQLSNDENYDKSVLSLSSAGLGLSLAFIRNLNPMHCKYLLILSWVLFAIAIIVTIISFRVSQFSIERQMEYAEEYYINGKGEYHKKINPFSSITKRLNYSSGTAFILAVIFTVTFVSINLVKGDLKMSEEKKKSEVSVQGGATLPTMTKTQDGATLPTMMKKIEEGATLPKMPQVEVQKGATLPGMPPAQNPTATQQGAASKPGGSDSSGGGKERK